MAEFSTKQREKLAERDLAMPDGSYPICNKRDLNNAIAAYGRSKNLRATRLWIIKRAKELHAEDSLPEAWKEE